MDVFNQYAIVNELVKYLSWNELFIFRSLNKLCYASSINEVVCRSNKSHCKAFTYINEEVERFYKTSKCPRLSNDVKLNRKIWDNFTFYKPNIVFVLLNHKDKLKLLDKANWLKILGKSSILCKFTSIQGIIGSNNSQYYGLSKDKRIKTISWIKFPDSADIRLVTIDSEIPPNTKFVLVLDKSSSLKRYSTNVFNSEDKVSQGDTGVLHAGGLINAVELYNSVEKKFEMLDHLSLCFGGDNLLVHFAFIEDFEFQKSTVFQEFESMKNKWILDISSQNKTIEFKCCLVFSCYLKARVKYQASYTQNDEFNDPNRASSSSTNTRKNLVFEQDLFKDVFPGVPLVGLLCEGELYEYMVNVIKTLKPVNMCNIKSVTSTYVLLSWLQ